MLYSNSTRQNAKNRSLCRACLARARAGIFLYNTTGFLNTAIGNNALYANSTGSFNTATGLQALSNNTTGTRNTATGENAFANNATGDNNTAIGFIALLRNATGSFNTAIGNSSDVSTGNLTNATAIGAGAVVDASNKVRLGNTDVTVIEGQVPYTWTSDRNKKENFHPVNGDEVLTKLRGLSMTSWNYKGQDAKQFRHYGPVAQDFFAAFGHDAVGTVGTPTTITSGDLDGILIIAVQALERRTVEQEKEIAQLKARLEPLEHRGCEVAAKGSAGL
jgi:endosialidase-like protein